MNPLVISGLYSFLANIIIALFVLKHGSKEKVNILFSLFSLMVSGWSVGSFLENIIVDKGLALWVLRCNYVFGVWLPPIYMHFVYTLTGRITDTNRIKLKIAYVMAIILTPLTFTPFFIPNLHIIPGTNYYISSPGILYFLFFSFFAIGVTEVLLHTLAALKLETGSKATQLKFMTLANGIAIFGGFEYFSRVFGFFNSPPLDDFILVVYLLVVAYAIVRHQLMDIEIIIKRTAVFAGLFAFVYGAFTLISVTGKEFFQSTLGLSEWVALVPTVILITFTLRPLENYLTEATERFLFQKKYDYRELLRTFTNEILTVLDLQRLADQTVAGLVRIIKLESASIFLFNKEKKIYELLAVQGAKESVVTLEYNSAVVDVLKASGRHLLKDKSVDKMEERSELHNTFKKLNAQLCMPIELHDELVGILFLGMKKSGEDYTQEDIDILTTLSRTEAIAISNARLFDELSKTQAEAAQREKMAVIGTLAAGINHEICNPLGIVRGQCEMFLLNQRDGFYDGKNAEELMKISSDIMSKVIKETDRATGITKKLSSFAKPSKRNEFEEVQVDKEVDEVLGLVNHDLSLNNIKVEKAFAPDFPLILADKKQVQEVLFNIIRNAAQAMDKKAGQITVSGGSLNGSAIVKIADNGSGIPEDKIGQIFNPFYTTKAPGKGTGLGLFIVKQVVERNKGTIAVESVAGQGTTFTLTFPVHHSVAVGRV